MLPLCRNAERFFINLKLKIMNIYKFGYWSEEEKPYHLLTCVNNYTEKQFKDLCVDLYIEAYNKSVEENGKEYADTHVEYLFIDVLEDLIVKFGFNEIVPTITFNPFGWASIINNDRNKINCSDLNLIRNKFKNNEI